jgi:DNA-binding response OmpR family regulator
MNHGLIGSQAAFLQKPFSLQVLAENVKELLRQSSPRVIPTAETKSPTGIS